MIPSTGFETISSNCFTPGNNKSTSPLNLLMMNPCTRFFSLWVSRSKVPFIQAKTPPRSMSPTIITGVSDCSAMNILTRSHCFKLISAGLPAPSIITRSYSSLSFCKAERTIFLCFSCCAK